MPDDPQDWTDEEWLAWLAAGDVVVDEAPLPPPGRPSLKDGLGAKMLAASMRGLHDAMYGPKDEPAVVIEASGDPPTDDPLDVHLDPDDPGRSVARVRPWLLRPHRHDPPGRPPPPGGG